MSFITSTIFTFIIAALLFLVGLVMLIFKFLRKVEQGEESLRIGAAVTFSELLDLGSAESTAAVQLPTCLVQGAIFPG